MHDHATIRAWKDADYRQMLSAEDAAAAQSPAGTIELDDGDLGDIAGGTAAVTQTTICGTSLGCVTVITLAQSVRTLRLTLWDETRQQLVGFRDVRGLRAA